MIFNQTTADILIFNSELGAGLTPAYIDANWLRWIAASVNKHLSKFARGIKVYLEGEDRKTGDETNFIEIRMDGPLIVIPQKGLYYLIYAINVLGQFNLNNSNFYTPQVILGSMLQGFTEQIPVYRYGDGPLDDQTLLGCLRIYYTGHIRDRGIVVGNFGIIRQDTRLIQGTINGQYRIELKDTGVFPNGSN